MNTSLDTLRLIVKEHLDNLNFAAKDLDNLQSKEECITASKLLIWYLEKFAVRLENYGDQYAEVD
jgi:hypothetical protein